MLAGGLAVHRELQPATALVRILGGEVAVVVSDIALDNAAEFIKAGAVAVALGSALAEPTAIDAGDWSSITARAKSLHDSIAAAKS